MKGVGVGGKSVSLFSKRVLVGCYFLFLFLKKKKGGGVKSVVMLQKKNMQG